jgi:hypothetical protein
MNNILLYLLIGILLASAIYFGYKFFKFHKVVVDLQKENLEYINALTEGHRAVELALKYEEFYNSTVGDIGEIVDSLREIVGKRQMLSDDPDVQNLVRLLSIAHDTLLGYINAKSPSEQFGDNTTGEAKN